MSFKYSAIGDNTPENREHCEKVGIKRTCSIVGNLIMVVQGTYTCFELEGKMGNNFNDAVNCIGNPALFQAVTAMRGDSDQYQWFKNIFTGVVWYNERHKCVGPVCYVKMSLAELQEHFNSK